MPHSFGPYQEKIASQAFHDFIGPALAVLPEAPALESRGDRPLRMNFENQLKALVFFHLEEHVSARHLIRTLDEDDFARENIAPAEGIRKSGFSEAVNGRGLGQLRFVFSEPCSRASGILPRQHDHPGQLVAPDGSLIDAVLSMTWADCRKASEKAKVRMGFNINQGIPMKIRPTEGKGPERPFFPQIISPGQTGIGDRGYQDHALSESLQAEGRSFVIRIRANTVRTPLQEYDAAPESIVFHDAEVLLGTPENNTRTEKPVRLVGYRVGGAEYRVATDRRDLSAEQVAEVCRPRWDIETFSAWRKRHLRVCHLIARSRYGLMVQILGGLITYLLLAIYCRRIYGEKVGIGRVREPRVRIRNELRRTDSPGDSDTKIFKGQNMSYAKN